MTGQELTRSITELKLSADDLGRIMDRPREVVIGWLASHQLPRQVSRQLEWHLALHRRDQQMREQGIPTCQWVERHVTAQPADTDALEKHLAELEAHLSSCAICQEREAFAATLPPLPPMPVALHVRVLGQVSDGVHRLPAWARPAAFGALLVGALTLLRAIVIVVVRQAPITSDLLLTVLAAIGLGAYGGLVGGVAYSMVREPTRRLGRAGDYVTGIVCVYAYLAAFGIPATFFTDEEMFHSAIGWTILLIVGALFGVIVGHSWFRSSAPGGGGA